MFKNCEIIAISKVELFGFSGTGRVTKTSDLSIFKKRIFKEKRIIQVQSWKLQIHWEILALTKKINLESYSLLLKVFASEGVTFEIKVSAKNMALF